MAVLAWHGLAEKELEGSGPRVHALATESIHASLSTVSTNHRVSLQVLRLQQGLPG